MSLLRFASLLALTLWTGGLAVLGGVGAPAIFAVLEDIDPAHGRTAAGRVFGAVFERFQHLAWILGGLLVLIFIARAALGPRPRRFGLRLGTIGLMLALSVASTLWIAPRIDHLRDTTPGQMADRPADDPIRREFGRLHGLSNGFALLTLFGGVWLIWIEAREE
ncbi:MAG: DUF4149 domain-containing protein [Vicinamibacterales bacterium]